MGGNGGVLAGSAGGALNQPLLDGPQGGGGPAAVLGCHGGGPAGSAGGAPTQPLLDGQQVGGGPAALLECPVGDHADRSLGQEPVGQLPQLHPSYAGPGGAGG